MTVQQQAQATLDKFGYLVWPTDFPRPIGEVFEGQLDISEKEIKLVIIGESTREDFNKQAAFLNRKVFDDAPYFYKVVAE